jgi:hypothetical protein
VKVISFIERMNECQEEQNCNDDGRSGITESIDFFTLARAELALFLIIDV